MVALEVKYFAGVFFAQISLSILTIGIAYEGFWKNNTNPPEDRIQYYVTHVGQGVNFFITFFVGIAIAKGWKIMALLKFNRAALETVQTFVDTELSHSFQSMAVVAAPYMFIVKNALYDPHARNSEWEDELEDDTKSAYEVILQAFRDDGVDPGDSLSDRFTEYKNGLVKLHTARMHYLPVAYIRLLSVIISVYYGVLYTLAHCADDGWYSIIHMTVAASFNNMLYAFGVSWAEPFSSGNTKLKKINMNSTRKRKLEYTSFSVGKDS